jgi:uncharacterized membrane protein YgcG
MQELQTIFRILVVIACLVSAGCVQSAGNSPVPPVVPQAGIPAPDPATPIPTAAAASVPQAVVTVIHYVSPLRDLKDSGLLFTLQVPVEWNVSTWRITNSDTSDYRTDLVGGNAFFVTSYPSSRSREQEFRDQFRQWSPVPVESTVTMNDIKYDRFETRANGNTTVAYLANTNSANERGYASVLVFMAHDSNRFEREDFEKVVSSFRYFSTRSAGTIPGEEIPVYYLSENAVPHAVSTLDPRMFDTSEGDSVGTGYSGGSPTGGSTSGGGSSNGGGHCGH